MFVTQWWVRRGRIPGYVEMGRHNSAMPKWELGYFAESEGITFHVVRSHPTDRQQVRCFATCRDCGCEENTTT